MVRLVHSMLCLTSLICLTAAGAQTQTLYNLQSSTPEDYGNFGHWVASAGDVNNDGHDDVIVGAQYEGGGSQVGRAYIFGGNGGGLLYTLMSPNIEYGGYFGVSASSIGDLDGDGFDDILVGACREDAGALDAGRAYIFRGNEWSCLHTLQSPSPETDGFFGVRVSGTADVNNDGYRDAIVGAYMEHGGAYRAGKVYVFSGNGGNLLLTLQSPNPEYEGYFGWALSGLRDVDNDGHDEVVVGAKEEDAGASGAGRAYVFGGSNGDLLYQLVSPNPTAGGVFGMSLSAIGDADGNGYADVIVGARGENGGAIQAGRAYAFSGNGGGLLYTLQSGSPEVGGGFGYPVSGAGDVDDDGRPDVIVGAQWEDGGAPEAGRTYVFSGDGGGLFYTLQSPQPETGGRFGVRVAAAGDMNNDTRADVVVGACAEDGGATDAGRAYVFSGMDIPIELASFVAEPDDGAVRLVWTTLTETENLGFNLERACAQAGPFGRLNDSLIPGAGTTSLPRDYSYVDETVSPGATYWYRLEDISVAGQRAFHGPIRVAVPAGRELTLDVLGGAEPGFVLSFPGSGRGTLLLYDLVGRLVDTPWQSDVSEEGTIFLSSTVSRTLPHGLYAAVLTHDRASVTRRVVIAR